MLYFDAEKNRENVENTRNFAFIGVWQPCCYQLLVKTYKVKNEKCFISQFILKTEVDRMFVVDSDYDAS